MPKIVLVRPVDNYGLECVFDDGARGVVSLHDRLFGPMFEPLRNLDFFRQAFVDDFGAVAWPNGADLAPDAIYRQLRESAGVA